MHAALFKAPAFVGGLLLIERSHTQPRLQVWAGVVGVALAASQPGQGVRCAARGGRGRRPGVRRGIYGANGLDRWGAVWSNLGRQVQVGWCVETGKIFRDQVSRGVRPYLGWWDHALLQGGVDPPACAAQPA